jgi:hypothetical protein
MYRFACHTAYLAVRDPFTPEVALLISSVLHATAAPEAFRTRAGLAVHARGTLPAAAFFLNPPRRHCSHLRTR